MMQFLDYLRVHFSDREAVLASLATLVLVVFVWLGRSAALRFTNRPSFDSAENRLRWLARIRAATVLSLAVGLIVIWGAELRSFALSFVAVAVAVVLATKELIQCVNGALIRTATEAFAVGDRVEIAGIRGDVIASGPLATKLLEVGPSYRRTGRAVVIPNSMFLTERVTNETYGGNFLFHTVAIPLSSDADWQQAEEILLRAANDICREYLDDVRRHTQQRARRFGLFQPSVEPQVAVQLPEPDVIRLLVRLPARANKVDMVEQGLVRRFLSEYQPGGAARRSDQVGSRRAVTA
jgi:small-conductance mechanosensitive channel